MNTSQDNVIHWREYQGASSQGRGKRKFLKQLHPLMLSEQGYITTEGTKPHGVKSQGYGLGTGLQGIKVLWDSEYAKEKLLYDLKAVSFSVHFKQWFAEQILSTLIPDIDAKGDNLLWLKQWVLQESKALDKPDSPRQAKAYKLLTDLSALIDEKESSGQGN